MNNLSDLLGKLYVYCTDFIINLANLLGVSYYEVNFFLFCLLYPLLTIVLLLTYIIQKKRLKQLKSKHSQS